MSSSERQNIIVIASAGTGKTFRLVTEFVDSVLGSDFAAPIHPRAMLALTFTEKAAAEMRTRISTRLSEGDKNSRRQKCVRDLDQATITTYHSFCAKILRDYADRVGLDRRFRLLDTFEENELATKVARRVVLRHLEAKRPALLSLVARLQFEADGGTKGVVGNLIRIREQLVENGATPQSMPSPGLLAPNDLTASLSFEKTLKACVRAFEAYDVVVTNLSLGARTKIELARAAFLKLQQKLAKGSVEQFEVHIASLFTALREQISGRFGPDDMRKTLVSEISQLGTLLCTSFVALEQEAFRQLLQDFWVELETEKKSSMSLAFGDLLVLTRRLLREDLRARRELKARYQRILVDEYQDTSPIQEDIVTLLCESQEEERKLDAHEKALGVLRLSQGKLFVVGDPKQSIYGFRGSDVSLFHKMAHEIISQGGRRESLNVSRRSSASVVAVVNQSIPCPPDEILVAMREGGLGAGALITSGSEPSAITSEIVALLTASSTIAQTKSFEPKDIAVLVRRVKKAGAILKTLTQAGVPARIWGGEGFFERQEIVELISALVLILRPDDSVALLTVLRSPLVGFPDFYWAQLFATLQTTKESWTLDAVEGAFASGAFPDDITERVIKFCSCIKGIRAQSALISGQEALERLLQHGDYESAIASEPDAQLCFANIQKLKGLFIETSGDFTEQIEIFARKIRQVPKEPLGEQEVEQNAVRIMTIHQSKGLEFPVVFLADTAASIPSDTSDILFEPELGLAVSHRGRPIAVCAPDVKEWVRLHPTPIQAVRARLREKNEAELSRLLYVALTRARDLVYFVVENSDSDDKKSTDRGCTVRRLFTNGYESNFESMRVLMPKVCSAGELSFPPLEMAVGEFKMTAESESLQPQASSEVVNRRLLFASDLLTPPNNYVEELRASRLIYQSIPSLTDHSLTASVSGQLAHSLIRMATEQMNLPDFEDEKIMRATLDAGLRMQGYKYSISLKNLIDNCIATLESVIWPLLKAGFSFQFELPLEYETDFCVVKGFADAVAFRDDISCLIDFKSSSHAAKSERTTMQLLAYSAALQRLSAKRVFFASCVIGERNALEFEPFSDEGNNDLDRHLRELLTTV